MNLFLAESPLQIISCYELASQLFKGHENVLIVKYSGEKRKETHDYQIRKTVESLDWNNVIEISFKHSLQQLSWLKKRKHFFDITRKFKHKVDNLCIGEFRSAWMHDIKKRISPKALYLSDDGAAIITVKNNFLDKGIYHFSKSKKESNDNHYARPILFTSFLDNSEEEGIIHNDYRKLRSKNHIKETDNKTVLYFGSKYSEGGIMTLESELALIKKADDYYTEKGKTIIYIPHRGDSEKKLSLIKNTLNIKTNALGLPAELYILTLQKMPWGIAGAYTSALISLKGIADFDSVCSFRIPSACVNPKHKDTINAVYDEYLKSGIEIID
ncbi:polysialyltransferase family glycosyltransferase [Cobetia crustatorum]|uniref:polysialyltransferase family glycosyltransferase n=1 Tax=Cobetia crustatorum TaxID=553385 RepID=UPI000469E42D|nr:polysialyltransferase family glycosyltransferase [Cobetia crustatorum]